MTETLSKEKQQSSVFNYFMQQAVKIVTGRAGCKYNLQILSRQCQSIENNLAFHLRIILIEQCKEKKKKQSIKKNYLPSFGFRASYIAKTKSMHKSMAAISYVFSLKHENSQQFQTNLYLSSATTTNGTN